MNIGKILSAIVKVAKNNPTLVIGAISVGKQIVSAVRRRRELMRCWGR